MKYPKKGFWDNRKGAIVEKIQMVKCLRCEARGPEVISFRVDPVNLVEKVVKKGSPLRITVCCEKCGQTEEVTQLNSLQIQEMNQTGEQLDLSKLKGFLNEGICD